MLKNLKKKIKIIEEKKKDDFEEHVRKKIDDNEIANEIIEDKNKLFQFDNKLFNRIKSLIDKMFSLIKFPINENNYKEAEKFIKKNFLSEEAKVIFKKKNFSDIESYLQKHYDILIYNQYLHLMDAKRFKILDDLYAKMEEIGKMTKGLKVFSDLFGRFWNLSIHDLYSLPMEDIKKFSKLLKEKNFLNRIAELLGRLAVSLKEYEDCLIKEIKYFPNKKKMYSSPTNTIGITLGNELQNLLLYQFALRKKQNTKAIFNKNFIEKKLLQFERKDLTIDEVIVNKKDKKLKNDKRGPFVIVVDTSGSMHGEPETIAKAFALALIQIANKDDRKCFIISFSTSTIEFDATNLGSNWNELFNFLSMSFSGGTDINPAISSAVKKIEEKEYKNADVILISDLIINSLDETLEKKINVLKEKKVRFHSLTIGQSYHKLHSSFLDNNWIFDGSKESIDNIIKSLDKLDKKDINLRN